MELILDRVTKQYKNKIVVDRLNVVLKEGVYGLLGANGAGKTTLMRMICGIAKISSGEIRLDSEEIGDMGSRYRDLLGYLPQDFGYYPNFSAMEFMLYIASLKGLNRSYARKQSKILLEKVGLEAEMRHKIKTFSGGMRQRLGIAQALINDPRLLILDEPTAGMDAVSRRQMWNLLKQLNGKNLTILLTTHYMEEAEHLCARVAMMNHGKIEKISAPQDFIDELGQFAVDETEEGKAVTYYFHTKEEALKFAAQINGSFKLRDTTLEDAFVERAKKDEIR